MPTGEPPSPAWTFTLALGGTLAICSGCAIHLQAPEPDLGRPPPLAPAGGAIALSIMIWKGKLFRSLRNMARFFFTALVPGLKTEMPKEENSDPFPLGVAIAVGFAWAMVEEKLGSQPLFDMGI